MRRGQVFSMDAMLSMVLVIMLLGTITATSETMKAEITSMIEWYERTNTANNMLDVLTKTPGEPADWERNPGSVVVPGLLDVRNPPLIDYAKLMALNASKSSIVGTLANLSQGKNFLLAVYTALFHVEVNGTLLGNATPTFSGTYIIPTPESGRNIAGSTYFFALINGNIVTDPASINASMDAARWIIPAERKLAVGRLEYNFSRNPSGDVPLLYGVLEQAPPQNARLTFSVPDSAGNLTIVVRVGSLMRGILVYKQNSGDRAKAVLRDGSGTVLYEGNITGITIPLVDVFGGNSEGKVVGLWLYSIQGWDRGSVEISIVPDVRWTLRPSSEPAVLRIWVWEP
ncbi:hypothetical protein E3E36_06390 [Thermococcus sp. M36]|uniref:hypothetical protein n=1 Tax=Thermococcus sp. M36 TaxID=1638261 RepID=UPI0014391F22|nr:hypothetical protein [Thermococcus sp. M36]NJE05777.1 hypothetical protein [Thermococcus sp. M36]